MSTPYPGQAEAARVRRLTAVRRALETVEVPTSIISPEDAARAIETAKISVALALGFNVNDAEKVTEEQLIDALRELFKGDATAAKVLGQRELARIVFGQKVQAQLAADPKIDFTEAQRRVSREKPELLRAAYAR